MIQSRLVLLALIAFAATPATAKDLRQQEQRKGIAEYFWKMLEKALVGKGFSDTSAQNAYYNNDPASQGVDVRVKSGAEKK